MERIFLNPDTAAVFLIFSIPIVAIIAYYWHESIKARSINELKRSMVDRGMSAQEIEQVLNAGSKVSKKK